MRLPRPLLHGRLLRRYKRFLADVRLEDGEELTVHCPNPGAMTGCDAPGSRIVVSDSQNQKRKLRLTWELVHVDRTWVGINTGRTNAVAREGIERGSVPELTGYPALRPEVRYGERSRIDFLLEDGERRCYVEVKNTTLAVGDIAMFPDAVTARGLRHLDELAGMVREGHRAVMLFVVSRADCTRWQPASHVDPAYSEGLRRAAGEGVEILVHAARLRADAITLSGPLPWSLETS